MSLKRRTRGLRQSGKLRGKIGEGSYGCVHKPSIPCKNKPFSNINYADYVSKLMLNTHAEKEMSQFVKMDKYDKQNIFHLGMPLKCQPNYNDNTIYRDIKHCKYLNEKDVEENPQKYSLLVLKYGGPDLERFCETELTPWLKSGGTQFKIDSFWLEVRRLFLGLAFFKKHHIVHYDIKPNNILFDSKTGKLTFIDFGLMSTLKIISDEANKNEAGIFHWSYPISLGFVDRDTFTTYHNYSAAQKREYKNNLVGVLLGEKRDLTGPLSITVSRASNFALFFDFMGLSTAAEKKKYLNKYLEDLDRHGISDMTYRQFLSHVVKTVDVFGLGFTLKFVLDGFKRVGNLGDDLYKKLNALFLEMTTFLSLDAFEALKKYDEILKSTGILKRLGGPSKLSAISATSLSASFSAAPSTSSVSKRRTQKRTVMNSSSARSRHSRKNSKRSASR